MEGRAEPQVFFIRGNKPSRGSLRPLSDLLNLQRPHRQGGNRFFPLKRLGPTLPEWMRLAPWKGCKSKETKNCELPCLFLSHQPWAALFNSPLSKDPPQLPAFGASPWTARPSTFYRSLTPATRKVGSIVPHVKPLFQDTYTAEPDSDHYYLDMLWVHYSKPNPPLSTLIFLYQLFLMFPHPIRFITFRRATLSAPKPRGNPMWLTVGSVADTGS